jgi:hypothetical protein
MRFKTHYKNPHKPGHTICGHDYTIPGRTFSHVTEVAKDVTCAGCKNAVKIRERKKEKNNI